jgi:hypothetical protein
VAKAELKLPRRIQRRLDHTCYSKHRIQKDINHINYNNKVNTQKSFIYDINNMLDNILLSNTMNMVENNPRCTINIQTNPTRKLRHESALHTAAHILVCLTQEGKSTKEIASEDFDNNLELVSVWIDYMTAINWMYKTSDGSNNHKWIVTDNGKKWVEKILQNKR